MTNRYSIQKLGFVNFWYYDFEEFHLSDGKLLLRGSNGSGKSVTMQSFIPLLLDGNKSPYRLDPFGTNARTISGYLLDEENTERTGYLYMEFKRNDSDHCLTLGMGIKAQQNMSPKSWYFILNDGRKINEDLFLYRDAGQKIPLTRKQLQNELGEGNFFTDTQKDYMRKVNEYLFGFDDLDSYEELLNLLISIRSPKLSKDFKPTEIYKVLTDSLKVLSEDDLRPVSDALESMDSLKDSLEENEAALKAAKKINTHYDKYNRHLLGDKAAHFVQGKKRLDDILKEKSLKEKTVEDQKESLEQTAKELESLDTELRRAEEVYENLQSGEGFKLKKDELRLENELSRTKTDELKKEQALALKKATVLDLDKQIRDLADTLEQMETTLKENLDEVDNLSKEIAFEAGRSLEKEDLSGVETLLKTYEKKIKDAREKLLALEQHNHSMEEEEKKIDGWKRELDLYQKELRRAEELFSTEKENYKVAMTMLSTKNTEWILTKEDKTQLFSQVEKVEKVTDLYDLQGILTEQYGQLVHKVNGEIHKVHEAVSHLTQQKNEIEKDILKLQNQKELEPDRSPGVISNRIRLKEQNIPFIPLYKAIDFIKDVPNETRDAMEAALSDMGILDALIIEEKHKEVALNFPEGTEDRYLFSKPNIMSFNLSSFLKVDASMENTSLKKSMDEILQSIFLDQDQEIFVDENAHFNLGILRGRGNPLRKHAFIGEAARRRQKEDKILALRSDVEGILREMDHLDNERALLGLRKTTLEKEYGSRPKLIDMESGLNLIHETIIQLSRLEASIKTGEDRYYVLNQQRKEMEYELFYQVKEIQLPHTSSSFYDALEVIGDLKDLLRDANILTHQIDGNFERKKDKQQQATLLQDEVEALSDELHEIQIRIRTLNITLHSVQEALSKTNISEIQAKMQQCTEIKRTHPEKIKAFNMELGRVKENISNLHREIALVQTSLVIKEQELENLSKIFMEEYQLGYVLPKENHVPLKLAKNVLDALSEDKSLARDTLTNNLIANFQQNSAELREYNLHLHDVFGDDKIDLPSGVLRKRLDIQCRIQGITSEFLQLISTIEATVDEQRLLISAEERRIFEEVLMNTVSDKIRSKIYQSKDWIDKINTIMGGMNTTSTLKLSLTWTPNKAEEEGQLNVTDIIDILDKKGRNTEESLKDLANHFILKVKETLRSYEGTGEARNYHSIIKEVLDYRKWYQFKLHYTKQNDRKKELTNNEFFKFSGGEKAMSMYIPLFSALYARYLKANKDCPRIITMDEAFAGVDEENIRDMFKLLKKLDMDYILNSQILWGTYDTVDNLAISELIRENNEKMVTVIRYHWNGHEKTLVDE